MITLETARKYLKLPTTLDEENFTPFVPDAIEKHLRPFIGDALIELLWKFYNGTHESEDAERLQALFNKVEGPLSRFTFLIAAPSLDINIGQQGFTTAGSGNFVPASKERVTRFSESIEQLGWSGIETILRFIEANKEDYDEWTESDAYKSFIRGYIRSAERFNHFVDIDNSRLKFYRYRQTMDLVETLQLNPLLGDDLFENLNAESITAPEIPNANRLKAFDLCCKFVALQTASEQIGESFRAPASIIYNTLRDFLNANPEDFPEKFPEGSTAVRAPYPRYSNSEESSVFEFGAQ